MLSVQTQAQAAIHMLQARSRTRVGPANAFLLRGQTAGLAGSPHEGCIKLAGNPEYTLLLLMAPACQQLVIEGDAQESGSGG